MQHKPSLPQSFISSYREDQRKTKLWTLYSYGHHNKTGDKRNVGPKKSKSKMNRISASTAQTMAIRNNIQRTYQNIP